MNPSASSSVRWKIDELQSLIQEERVKNHSIPFLAVTETWLKSYISNAQLQIPGYVVSRSDRGNRTGGGVLLYSHQNLPVSDCESFDDGVCEAVFCRFNKDMRGSKGWITEGIDLRYFDQVPSPGGICKYILI